MCALVGQEKQNVLLASPPPSPFSPFLIYTYICYMDMDIYIYIFPPSRVVVVGVLCCVVNFFGLILVFGFSLEDVIYFYIRCN